MAINRPAFGKLHRRGPRPCTARRQHVAQHRNRWAAQRGQSTLFNALTKAQNAQAANYPFCTIEPNKATVAVPDARVDALTAKARPRKTIYASVDFIDIAGLVRGASKGEGLGNQFLGNIRECAAIVEVVRCFEDENVTHVDGSVSPLRDVETIELELLLADAEHGKTPEKTAEDGQRQQEAKAAAEHMVLLANLNAGKSARISPCLNTRLFLRPGGNWACSRPSPSFTAPMWTKGPPPRAMPWPGR